LKPSILHTNASKLQLLDNVNTLNYRTDGTFYARLKKAICYLFTSLFQVVPFLHYSALKIVKKFSNKTLQLLLNPE